MSTANLATEAAATRQTKVRPLVPDRKLVFRLLNSGGSSLRQCVQCATCSVACGITSDAAPLPRKEMLWAQWGMTERLMADVDLWLCHQCHDCTERCPRGARPGDVMAALRRECIAHHAVPGFLGRCATRPGFLPWLVLVSAALLLTGAIGWQQIGAVVGEVSASGSRIVIPFWYRLPHGFLVTLFGSVLVFDLLALGLGLRRFWLALCQSNLQRQATSGQANWSHCLRSTFTRIVWHDDFAKCENQIGRRVNHTLVVYAMLGLCLVDVWVILARFNPMREGLVYPMSLGNPWKILANLAGALLVVGCIRMMGERLRRASNGRTASSVSPGLAASGTYTDWLLLAWLLVAALSGFLTEALHFARIDSLRYAAYAGHLVSVLTLLLLLPYSKLAHLGYRSVALLFARRHGLLRTEAHAVRQPSEAQ